MRRFPQILLIASTIGFSWLTMMLLHEGGHVLSAWLSGGKVAEVVLSPLAFSRTDYAENPHPLFTAWGGVLWGSLLPMSLYGLARWFVPVHDYLARFLAGFCLITNGAYVGAGSFFAGGGDDAGVILQHGGEAWTVRLFGIVAVAAGLWLWNGLGPKFGLGAARGEVDRKAALAMTVTAAMIACLETFGNWCW
jgi:hypothetical protein